MKRLAPWIIGSALAGCGGAAPRDQWVVVVRTDAPIPQFGDRLLLEVLNPSGQLACSGCRREFGFVDGARFPFSYGIVASAHDLRVRARLYRSSLIDSAGLPSSPALIDRTVRLPAPAGSMRVSLELRMECFGVPGNIGEGKTCDPSNGQLGPVPVAATGGGDPAVAPGSFPPARRNECSTQAAGTRCVPGGLFMIGAGGHGFVEDGAKPERLVRVAPFLLDVDEFTVGAARTLARDGVALRPAKRATDVAELAYACTWLGIDDASNDAMPLNCVTRADAQRACEATGGRLPTEAEWEWAAGNLEVESPFPWGDDPDVCGHAVVSRSRSEYELRTPTSYDYNIDCRVTPAGTLPFGPVAGGHRDDVTKLGLRNLGGNLREWTSDRYAPYDGECWNPEARLLDSPRCQSATTGVESFAVRGGGWATPVAFARAQMRDRVTDQGASPTIGFRCARDAGTSP